MDAVSELTVRARAFARWAISSVSRWLSLEDDGDQSVTMTSTRPGSFPESGQRYGRTTPR